MSDFYNAILNVRFEKPTENYLQPDQRKSLKYLNELIFEMNKNISEYKLKNPEPLKLHLVDILNDILPAKLKIFKEFEKLRDLDIKGLNYAEREKNQTVIEYYHEILSTCEDAITYIADYLVIGHPTIFEGKNTHLLEYLSNHLKQRPNIKKLKETKQPLPAENKDITQQDFKTDNWFIVGLLFANGEMENLKKQFNSVSTKIAKHLGNKIGFRPYISESLSENKKHISDKNIFSKPDKLLKIFNHCKDNEIEMTERFIQAYKEQNPHE